MLCTEHGANVSLHAFDFQHRRSSMFCDDRGEIGPYEVKVKMNMVCT
jgi:hypothetical protein